MNEKINQKITIEIEPDDATGIMYALDGARETYIRYLNNLFELKKQAKMHKLDTTEINKEISEHFMAYVRVAQYSRTLEAKINMRIKR